MAAPEEIVIDVNVFMTARAKAADRADEQRECVAFLRRVHDAQKNGTIVLREPPVFVLEVFAVSNRRRRDWSTLLYPEFQFDPLATVIEPFTEDDAHVLMEAHAAAFPLDPPFVRGADLEFLAVARKHACALISCDEGLLRYGREGFCTVVRPRAWRGPGTIGSAEAGDDGS
jgi:hypothetical protein